MTSANNHRDHFNTLAVHAGVEPDPATGAIMTPIYQTSTFAQTDVNEHMGYDYCRAGNPTRTALEEALAALEGGRFGLSFSSGMAAIDTLIRLVRPGETVLCGNDVYGGTFRLFDKVLTGFGLHFIYVDTADTEAVKAALASEPIRMVWLESPTNPALRLADIATIAEEAHKTDTWVTVDNTFASPALQRPFALGADFIIHSTTKYIGGHSDVVGGAIIVNDEVIHERLKFLQKAVGAVSAPMDCFLTLRGIKTLGLRMRAHCDNGMAVAQFLEDHPAVERVFYPGLESHPQYELARRQMAGPGGMVSFTLRGGEEAARAVALRTRLFTLAESLGGVESLIELPAAMTHASVGGVEAQAAGFAVDPGLVRISVGIEHPDDLIADLKQALTAA
jgi:cystathionine beta-lyase/cystathionine gamma-synthase